MDLTPHEHNRFRVLLKDIDTGMYLTESILPERLVHYTVGSHYKDSLPYKYIPSEGETIRITVESKGNNLIQKIGSVITDDEYDLRHSFKGEKLVDYTKDNKQQFCVILENKRQTVIFPCTLIGANYYFLSTPMREHLFSQDLKGMCESVEFDPEKKKAVIKLKPWAADYTAPYIARFATDEFAKKRWHAVYSSIRSRQNKNNISYIPIIADFPVRQIIDMEIRGFRFNDSVSGRGKILVFDIIKENSSFGFNKLDIVSTGREGSSTSGNETVDGSSCTTTDWLVNRTPSSTLSPAIIIEKLRKMNINVAKMKITKHYLPGKGREVIIQNQEGSVDPSVSAPETEGSKDARHAHLEHKTAEEEQKDKKEAFTLVYFTQMMEKLKAIDGVGNLQINGPLSMPVKYQGERIFSLREVYNKGSSNKREYLYIIFKYGDHSVCLIEIDHRNLSNSPATYCLVSKGNYDFAQDDVDEVLKPYVGDEKIKDIADKIRKKGFDFISKKHPAKKEENYYMRWCKELLRKIISF